MESIEKSIKVNVPVCTAYNQWTQFEEFPRFMAGVEIVRQLDHRRLHWRVNIGGRAQEWDAEISEQTPDQHIVWRSTAGVQTGGVVTFHAIDDHTTRILVHIDYEPDGWVEIMGHKLGFMSRCVDTHLRQFKRFIEWRGRETGAWRGKIMPEEVFPSNPYNP